MVVMCFTISAARQIIVGPKFWLSDSQWERLQPLLPDKPRGVPRLTNAG